SYATGVHEHDGWLTTATSPVSGSVTVRGQKSRASTSSDVSVLRATVARSAHGGPASAALPIDAPVKRRRTRSSQRTAAGCTPRATPFRATVTTVLFSSCEPIVPKRTVIFRSVAGVAPASAVKRTNAVESGRPAFTCPAPGKAVPAMPRDGGGAGGDSGTMKRLIES